MVNVPLFGWIVFFLVGAPVSGANLVGYGLVVLHLVVGAAYWIAKRRQLQEGLGELPGVRVFWWLRLGCQVGLAGGLVVIVVAMAGWWASWVPGLLLYGLAVAEYVNYFHWQLMHDTREDLRRLVRTGRLPRSHLYADLRETRGAL